MLQQIKDSLKKMEIILDQGQLSVIDIDLLLQQTRDIYSVLLSKKDESVNIQSDLPSMPLTIEPVWQEEIINKTAMPEMTAEVADIADRDTVIPFKTETPPAAPNNTGIRRYIGINDKYQFISELFGNNKDAYEAVINKINTLSSYDEACNWLQEEVQDENNWDEDHFTVHSFYATLNQFFSAR